MQRLATDIKAKFGATTAIWNSTLYVLFFTVAHFRLGPHAASAKLHTFVFLNENLSSESLLSLHVDTEVIKHTESLLVCQESLYVGARITIRNPYISNVFIE